MFKATATSTFKADRTMERIKKDATFAISWLTGRVRHDTEPFVPRDTGDLVRTARTHSDGLTGELTYNTPYARRLYYGVNFNFSTDRNKQATHHWFAKAKSIWLEYWLDKFRKLMGGL